MGKQVGNRSGYEERETEGLRGREKKKKKQERENGGRETEHGAGCEQRRTAGKTPVMGRHVERHVRVGLIDAALLGLIKVLSRNRSLNTVTPGMPSLQLMSNCHGTLSEAL